MVSIPKNLGIGTIISDLTVRVRLSSDELKDIQLFEEDDDYLIVPRKYGHELSKRLKVKLIDATSIGYGAFRRTSFKVNLYPYQEDAVSETVEKFKSNYDLLLKSQTGTGKTNMALAVVHRLKSTALIVVDQENIKEQWIERIGQVYGLPPDKVGIIQGSILDYEDKQIAIGMLQTLYHRDLPIEVLRYFGVVVFDESHVVSSEKFSEVCNKLPARYRLGITATPRSDQYRRIVESHIGKPEIIVNKKHDRSSIRFVNYDGLLSKYANSAPKAGRYINEITEDTERNWLIVDIIQRLYNNDRIILAVSDRIEHLENLKSMCIFAGIPESDIGIISGYSTEWRYAKDPTPKRKPDNYEKGTEYSPVSIQRLKARVGKKNIKSNNKEVQDSCKIKFATYSIFGKAVDVPELDAGIDCTPRSRVEQVHGRILRSMEGKKSPIWVTIRDRMSYRAEYQFRARILDYRKSNAEVYEWNLDKGIKRIVNERRLIDEVSERIKYLQSML